MPRVSVIIPTFNYSEVLPYSIGSVLWQSFQDFEVLVVGDACTDNSEEVVARIGDPRVRWINLAVNVGEQSGPNNEGLRQAEGEYIAYLGHDDLFMPQRLKIMVNALDTGASVVFGVVAAVSRDNQVRLAMGTLDSLNQRNWSSDMWMTPTALMHQKEVAQHVGGWRFYRDIRENPDIDFQRRVFEAGFRGEFVPRLVTVRFRAVERRNVYVDRPHHEQAEMMNRIRTESDFEQVMISRILAEKVRSQSRPRGFRSLAAQGCKHFYRILVDRYPWLSLKGKGGTIDKRRAIRGLSTKE